MIAGPLQYGREAVSRHDEDCPMSARIQCHQMGAWSPWLSGRRMNRVDDRAWSAISYRDICVFGSVETVIVTGFQDNDRTIADACRSLTHCTCSHMRR